MTTDQPTKSIYVLIANRAAATVFASHGPRVPMDLVAHIEHPRGRLHSNQIDSDRPGRAFDRVGGGRHALAGEETAREHVEREFAEQLAVYLDRHRCAGYFDRLILIAGPRFLGHLRMALNVPTRCLVIAELDKELIEPTQALVREHLEGIARV